MKKNKSTRVTFEELQDDLSNFEVAFLSFCRATEIIRSARSLITDSMYKPKVAVVSFEEVCSNREQALEYKQTLKRKFFEMHSHVNEEHTEDEYDVSVG